MSIHQKREYKCMSPPRSRLPGHAFHDSIRSDTLLLLCLVQSLYLFFGELRHRYRDPSRERNRNFLRKKNYIYIYVVRERGRGRGRGLLGLGILRRELNCMQITMQLWFDLLPIKIIRMYILLPDEGHWKLVRQTHNKNVKFTKIPALSIINWMDTHTYVFFKVLY